MTRRQNPYSTHWDKQIRLSRLTGKAALLYSAFELIQTALYYEGILIDLDPRLYMPALEKWCKIYPEYLTILLDLTIQVNNNIDKTGEIPPFALEFFLSVFKELDVMVNGEVENNLHIYNRSRWYPMSWYGSMKYHIEAILRTSSLLFSENFGSFTSVKSLPNLG